MKYRTYVYELMMMIHTGRAIEGGGPLVWQIAFNTKHFVQDESMEINKKKLQFIYNSKTHYIQIFIFLISL